MTRAINKVMLCDPDADLGTFTKGGKTFNREGYCDVPNKTLYAKVPGSMGPLATLEHEVGHAEFAILQYAAGVGVQQIEDEMKNRGKGPTRSVETAMEFMNKFTNSGLLIKDPKTTEQRVYNFFREKISKLSDHVGWQSNYAESWDKEYIKDRGITVSLRTKDKSIFDFHFTDSDRAQNENYAEFKRRQLAFGPGSDPIYLEAQKLLKELNG